MQRIWSHHRFGLLCLAVALTSLVAGDWLARSLLLDARLAEVETLRRDGGHYVVNAFLTRDYRPDAESAVVFGDSSNDSTPDSDRDKRMITEMLDDALADHPITPFGVSFPGNAVDWMSSHLRYLVRRHPDLDYAVIPLNLRWISPAWRGKEHHNEVRTSYELHAAGPFLWALGIELPYLSPAVPFDPKAGPVETVIGPLDAAEAALGTREYIERHGGKADDVARRINHLRLGVSYGFELTPTDPLYRMIEQIAGLCADSGLRCLFYLPPFNLEYIEQTVAPVARVLSANLQQVRGYMRSHGHALLDLSRGLAPAHFHDTVNEHVDEVGRRRIAGCLARALRRWHEVGDPGDDPAAGLLACTGNEADGFRVGPGLE